MSRRDSKLVQEMLDRQGFFEHRDNASGFVKDGNFPLAKQV
jgi:hypothetical protein